MDDGRRPPNGGGDDNLPAMPAESGSTSLREAFAMPPAMALWFDDRLFNRARLIAKYLASAEGIVPQHLLGRQATCFAVVSRSLTWRLDPYAVACATYQTPDNRVGYYGSLCQAIIENSGKLQKGKGGVQVEYFGDWKRIVGKFNKATSAKGKEYPVSAWKKEDEDGLGIRVKAWIEGEEKPREMELLLAQCYPRFSTLWATDPMTQIHYTAVRRFGTSIVPTLFMGVPFQDDAVIVDVTPVPERPRPEDFEGETAGAHTPPAGESSQGSADGPAEAAEAGGAPAPSGEGRSPPDQEHEPWAVTDHEGQVHNLKSWGDAFTACANTLVWAQKMGSQQLHGVWETNGYLLGRLREEGHEIQADELAKTFAELLEKAEKREHAELLARHEAEKKAAAPKPDAEKKAPAKAKAKDAPAETPPAKAEPAKAGGQLSPWVQQQKGPIPKSFRKGGRFGEFLNWFRAEVEAMPLAMFPDFISAEHWGDEWDFMTIQMPEEAKEIDKIIEAKKAKI
ncbi:MAG: recombinase RecT [Pseudomonadota bacterium]|nr:recombinase RecT [Pseudomonadota bacterium]